MVSQRARSTEGRCETRETPLRVAQGAREPSEKEPRGICEHTVVRKEEMEGGTLVISDIKSRPVYKLHVLSSQAFVYLAKPSDFFGPHCSYLVLAAEVQ